MKSKKQKQEMVQGKKREIIVETKKNQIQRDEQIQILQRQSWRVLIERTGLEESQT